ncbi:MAG: bifunctional enoyl-CoA hydratase/phosphate acetyltransferase [Acidimicrobiales bacterium]
MSDQPVPPPLMPANRTYDEITVGESMSVTRVLTPADISLVATMARGLVMELEGTAPDGEHLLATSRVGYSGWVAALVPTILATVLPGPGTIYRSQSLRFADEVHAGDAITMTLTVTEKHDDDRTVLLDCLAVNQRGRAVLTGVAEVVAPTEHRAGRPGVSPDVVFHDHQHYEALIEACRGQEPVPTAVAYPCERTALIGAIEAGDAGLIVPILVGPELEISALAAAESLDLTGIEIVDAPDAPESADLAVALVRDHRARMVMKGSLHTDELMRAVLDRSVGLRTTRRVSHVFMFDVPTYPKPLFVTDAAINITPTLLDKADICRNAIELGHALGIVAPKLAILGAVEVVNPAMPSTLDAAALCKMADRGQIAGGILDGPLAMDNAISPAAALTKHIVSPVAGDADVLVVPDLEAGNILYKNLTYLARADAAGIVVGARVPVVLTSRSDPVRTRLASAALGAQYSRWQRTPASGAGPG